MRSLMRVLHQIGKRDYPNDSRIVFMSYFVDRTEGGRTTVRDVLFDSEKRLSSAGVPSPSTDASMIVAHVLGVTRSRLLLQDPVDNEQQVRIEALLSQRLSRVPLQHILGVAHFRYLELKVGPGVFIPRPETELVAEAAIRALRESPSKVALDLCTGSGAVALAMATEVPGSIVYAVELDPHAADWTRLNVAAHAAQLAQVGSTVEVIVDDAALVAEPGHDLSHLARQVSVVSANPPYIPEGMIPREVEVRDHDPAMALYSGADGLTVTRRVILTAAVLLREGGLLVIEHADIQGTEAGSLGVPTLVKTAAVDADLGERIPQLPGTALFSSVVDRTDLNGLPRFTMAIRT
jgi:release factor glutamine methyltransferase